MKYYPVYLNARGRRCVIIGGGSVAGGRAQSLVEAGAQVTVIAPRLAPGPTRLAGEGRLTWLARSYRRGDLAGAFLAIGAANNRAANRQVWQEAEELGILVNIVDDPPHCAFIAPAVLRRGNLTVAISTGGAAPALAVRLRQQLEQIIGDEYGRFLELVEPIRHSVAARHPNFEQRRALWYQLVDSDALDLLRRGNEPEARCLITEIMGLAPGEAR